MRNKMCDVRGGWSRTGVAARLDSMTSHANFNDYTSLTKSHRQV